MTVTDYRPKQWNIPEGQGPPKIYVFAVIFVCLMKQVVSCLLSNKPVPGYSKNYHSP